MPNDSSQPINISTESRPMSYKVRNPPPSSDSPAGLELVSFTLTGRLTKDARLSSAGAPHESGRAELPLRPNSAVREAGLSDRERGRGRDVNEWEDYELFLSASHHTRIASEQNAAPARMFAAVFRVN